MNKKTKHPCGYNSRIFPSCRDRKCKTCVLNKEIYATLERLEKKYGKAPSN
ncbi:MAG: hypothetical protein UHK60_06730 [Acutalibacteraceae bacterium]|nr:hypothetical protein [Acutalibacteraceae bacterium]MEE1281927.1 hypothetical protein [Acutalibacteraceae bacterium]